MTQENTPNTNEVSIAFGLDILEKSLGNLSVKTKSRAVSAIDRLIGNIADVPSEWIANHNKKRNAQAQVEHRLIAAEGDAALAQLQSDTSFGQRAANSFMNDLARKQYNKEAIAAEAIQILNESTEEIPDNQDTALNPDWMNMFERYAQDASTEDLQKLWARILAGEIQRPKSFSKHALRIISEIDQETAQLFQKVAYLQFLNGFILKPNPFHGQNLIDHILLEEVGLLQEVNSFVNHPFEASPDGYIHITINSLFLVCKLNKKKLQLNVIKVTKAGQEISRIFPTGSDLEVCEAIASHIDTHCSEIIIGSFPLDQYRQGKIVKKIK